MAGEYNVHKISRTKCFVFPSLAPQTASVADRLSRVQCTLYMADICHYRRFWKVKTTKYIIPNTKDTISLREARRFRNG